MKLSDDLLLTFLAALAIFLCGAFVSWLICSALLLTHFWSGFPP